MSSVNHIYFNAKASNINGITDRKTVFNTRSNLSTPIIKADGKQGEWEVCVDRFKIPSGDIPKVRIYQNKLLLGVDYDQSSYLSFATQSTPLTTAANQNTAMVDLFQIAGGLHASKLDRETNQNYIDCESHEEFARVLDCALQFSMTPRTPQLLGISPAGTAMMSVDLFPGFAAGVESEHLCFRRITTLNNPYFEYTFSNIPLGLAPAPNALNQSLSVPSRIVYSDPFNPGNPATNPTKASRRMTDLNIKLTNLSPSVASTLMMSDLIITAKIGVSSTTATPNGAIVNYKQYVLAKNFLPSVSVSQFNTVFPLGIDLALFSRHNAEHFIPKTIPVEGDTPVFAFYEANKMKEDILMEYGNYNSIEVFINVLNPQPTGITLTGEMDFDIITTNAPGFGSANGTTSLIATDGTGALVSSIKDINEKSFVSTLPQIKWDSSNKKMVLMMEEAYATNGISIYFNEELNSMLSFNTKIIDPAIFQNSKLFQYTNGLWASAQNQVHVTEKLAILKPQLDWVSSAGKGYNEVYMGQQVTATNNQLANMNLNTNKYNQVNISIPNDPNVQSDFPNFTTGVYLLQYPEYQSSIFKRSFLYGLVVICNTISTPGEIVDDGRAAEKILTDFNVDETSVDARDYMLYEPAGNSFRWFDINSSAPISTIDLDVRYVDKYQKRHPLPIPIGTTGSIKLHFRRKYS
jgi:hypothetical protein